MIPTPGAEHDSDILISHVLRMPPFALRGSFGMRMTIEPHGEEPS